MYLSLNNDLLSVTGFSPNSWAWLPAETQVTIPASGLYTLTLGIREDGLRVDRLLLTTDTNYIPANFGPVETVTLFLYKLTKIQFIHPNWTGFN